MDYLGKKYGVNSVATSGMFGKVNVNILREDPSEDSVSATDDLVVYNGSNALSSTNYITLPSDAEDGKVIYLKSLNGSLYAQSSDGIYPATGSSKQTGVVGFGNTYLRTFIKTSLGWLSGY